MTPTDEQEGIEIRPFRTLEDYRECVALQEETWGQGFSERVPTAILKVAQHLGGVAAGAYDRQGRLVGFVFGMTGLDEEGPVHWSDMLAVRPGLRDSGLGRRMKAYQRQRLLTLGVNRMLWTFDPLQSRNAYLNLMKLGAVAREYRRDMYGQTDSVLHRGIGTDRLLALWIMDSKRVARRLAGAPDPEAVGREQAAPALSAESGGVDPRPGQTDLDLDAPVISVPIPADLDALKQRDQGLAVAWREATRRVFETYLGRSYELRELVRERAVSYYLLAKRTPHAD